MFYATGGWAYGHVRNCECGGAVYLKDRDASGYSLGGGVEWFVNNAWSVKAKYQYINLGENVPTIAGGVALNSFPGVVVHDDAFHTIRLGLNYKFGSM